MFFLAFKNNRLHMKFHRLAIILFIIFSLSATINSKSVYQIEELKINKNITITLEDTELYIITNINETGYLGHRIIIPESIGSLENKIYFASFNTTNIINDSVYEEVDSITEYKELKQDIGPFRVERDKYAVIKFIGLKSGEEMTVEAYYISKGDTVHFTIITGVIVLLFAIIVALIIKNIKKCRSKNKMKLLVIKGININLA